MARGERCGPAMSDGRVSPLPGLQWLEKEQTQQVDFAVKSLLANRGQKPGRAMESSGKAQKFAKILAQARDAGSRAVDMAWDGIFAVWAEGLNFRKTAREKRLCAAVIAGKPEDIEIVREVLTKRPWLANTLFPSYFSIDQERAQAAGRTPLMLALLHGQEKCVDFLIPLSDLEVQDENGDTALTITAGKVVASKGGDRMTEVWTRALIAAGANARHANKDGLTALMKAGKRNLPKTVAALLTTPGCDANECHGERSALFEAMINGSELCVESLAQASSQEVRDEAVRALLRVVNQGMIYSWPTTVSGMTFAGAPKMVTDARRATWWRLVDVIEPLLSEGARTEAMACAGEPMGEKLPMTWARHEAAALRAEMAAFEHNAPPPASSTGAEEGARDADAAQQPEPRAPRRVSRL